MPADADRPDTRPAAAVRNAEGLVQVQVRDVGADLGRPADPDQGIEVWNAKDKQTFDEMVTRGNCPWQVWQRPEV